MRTPARHPAAFLALLVVIPVMLVLVWSGTAAAGKIKSLEITPNPLTVNTNAKFNPEGKGVCALEMDFGDGRSEVYQDVDFSSAFWVVTWYTAPGMYDVKVKSANAKCSGKAAVVLTVENDVMGSPGLMVEKLCAMVDCLPPGKIGSPRTELPVP